MGGPLIREEESTQDGTWSALIRPTMTSRSAEVIRTSTGKLPACGPVSNLNDNVQRRTREGRKMQNSPDMVCVAGNVCPTSKATPPSYRNPGSQSTASQDCGFAGVPYQDVEHYGYMRWKLQLVVIMV